MGKIEELFPDEDKAIRTAKRHTLTAYLIGKDSSKDWTAGEVTALCKWIETDNANASLEAERIVRQYEAEHGQQPLGGV